MSEERTTVVPVMNGHPRDQAKVSVLCRWPLIRGNLTLKCVSRGIDNVAVQGRWPLTTGVAQGRYYCNLMEGRSVQLRRETGDLMLDEQSERKHSNDLMLQEGKTLNLHFKWLSTRWKCVSAQSYLFVSLNLRNGAYAKGYTDVILDIKGVIVEITNAILEITEIQSLLAYNSLGWPFPGALMPY